MSRSSSGGRSIAAPAKTMYSFPILDKEEILQCMSELRVPLTEAELDEPNPEVVRRAYTTVVELFLGVTPEELNQPKFAGLEELPYPELHEDSVPTLALFRAVCVLPRHAPLRRARL